MSPDLRDLAKELAELEDNEDRDEDEDERLEALRELQGQLFTNNLAEYAKNEATMIPVDDFRAYAEEFAKDVGYVGDGDNNAMDNYIDWERWAIDLKGGYAEVAFDGDMYLIRLY